jgi:Zn-dependent protease with chaperone function
VANFETEEKRRHRTRRKGSSYLRLVLGFVLLISFAGLATQLQDDESFGSLLLLVVAVAVVYLAYMYRRLNFDAIVLRGTNARIVDKFQAFHVHNVVEEVCVAAGLEKPRIAVIDDPALNAFSVSMRDTDRNVIVFTTGLIYTLTRDELQGVVAHELAQMVNRSDSYFHADATAVRLTRNPAGLRQALEKVAAGSSHVKRFPGKTRHLWFADPVHGAPDRSTGVDVLRLGGHRLVRRQTTDPYADPRAHPPLQERIEILRRLEGIGPAPAAPPPPGTFLAAGEVLPRTPEASAKLTRKGATAMPIRSLLGLFVILFAFNMFPAETWFVLLVVLLLINGRRRFSNSKRGRKTGPPSQGVPPDTYPGMR